MSIARACAEAQAAATLVTGLCGWADADVTDMVLAKSGVAWLEAVITLIGMLQLPQSLAGMPRLLALQSSLFQVAWWARARC